MVVKNKDIQGYARIFVQQAFGLTDFLVSDYHLNGLADIGTCDGVLGVLMRPWCFWL